MTEFLWSALAAACLVCALLSLRFWRLSRELVRLAALLLIIAGILDKNRRNARRGA